MQPETILTLLIWLPLLAGLAMLFWPATNNGHRTAGLIVSALVLLLSIVAWQRLGTDVWAFSRPWVPSAGIRYALMLDGVNIILVLLLGITGWLGLAAANLDPRLASPRVTAGMLLAQAGMMGAALAQDAFLFYVFFELMLLPVFLMIGIWGGEQRIKATLKFAVFTIAGSLLMFTALLYVVWRHHTAAGIWSFALSDLIGMHWGQAEGLWLLSAFIVAFGIKAPIFPLHGWLPDTYVEAPFPVTFILAAAMSKLGIYGLLRFALPLFPEAAHTALPVLMCLSALGIVYGGLLALVQTDAKRLVAYASFSHLGLIAFGLFSLEYQGIHGSLVHMLNHGLTTGGLFLVLGCVGLRLGSTEISRMGGIAKGMPLLAATFLVITFGSIGLPGLNGFVGEFLLLLGGFMAHNGLGLLAVTGVIISAAYMLWFVQRAWFGPENPALGKLPDMKGAEAAVLLPIVALVIVLGLYPKPLLDASAPGVKWVMQYTTVSTKAAHRTGVDAAHSTAANTGPDTAGAIKPLPGGNL
ncbi:MAG: NADH-quinone oxidoreductase subunit M [Candidatus Sericytochromatia bacterium]|nr:NADH-quinone oxidoreductase subunit M [Candidatus Sericytochromatia bacterium]